MILDRILEHKKAELRRKESRDYLTSLKRQIADQPSPLGFIKALEAAYTPCLLYTSPSPRDRQKSRMPSSA